MRAVLVLPALALIAGLLGTVVLSLGGSGPDLPADARRWLRDRGLIAGERVQSDGCAVTLVPGDDVARAVRAAPAETMICLGPGDYGALSIVRPRAGVALRGAGVEATVIRAAQRDALTVTDAERFTLAGLTLRGGSPAGLYVARVRGLALADLRIEDAVTGIHAELRSTLTLTNVTVSGSGDYGLLIRRGASLSGSGVRVVEHRGIGIGALDAPGAVTLSDSEITRTEGGRGDNIVFNGWERFALTGVILRGGNPAGLYAAKSRELTLRNVRVERAHYAVHIDDNTPARMDGVEIVESTGVGLLLQRGGSVEGRGVRILDTHGTGVSAINGPGLLALRESEIARVAAAGLFAGVAGCADLPPASLAVPECFLQDLQAQISTARVQLQSVRLTDTQGPCLVFFAGVKAELRDSTLTRCELTGLFAWGATADVSGTVFEDNAEHAIEYRAFPDPRGEVVLAAEGTIERSAIRGTRPLEGPILGDQGPGPVLGGGVLAQGARVVLRGSEVSGNRDIGVAYVNRSSGIVTDSTITGNGNTGLCIFPGSAVEVHGNILHGNRSDDPLACSRR